MCKKEGKGEREKEGEREIQSVCVREREHLLQRDSGESVHIRVGAAARQRRVEPEDRACV